MKLFNILVIFVIFICIQIKRGSGLIHKCKKWKNWSECKHNFIVRYCITDKSLYEATDCENCGHWTNWSVCEEGKQYRYLEQCPHLKDERKCGYHEKYKEAADNNDDINVELTGAKINKKKLKQSLKPPLIHEQYNNRINTYTDRWDPHELKNKNVENVDQNENKNVNVNEKDLTKNDGISNVQNTYETNQDNFIVKNESGKSNSRNTPNTLSPVEQKQEQTVNKTFINETPNNTEVFADVQHKAYKVEDFTFQSNPQISKHKILEEMDGMDGIEENATGSTTSSITSSIATPTTSTANLILNSSSNINESETKNETKLEHSSLPEFESDVIKKDTSLMNDGENVFSETNATETDTTKSGSSDNSTENDKTRGFSATNPKVLVAVGVVVSIVAFGALAACLYTSKKKSGEIEIESKNENYEVIFNEDDKVDHNKILYEEEFWGYE